MHRNLSARISPWVYLSLAGAILLSGCSDNPTGPPTPTPTSVSGNVNKAAIVGASVTIHKLNSNGSINGNVEAGPFTTDIKGDFHGSIPPGVSGPFAMVSVGGSYTDEATGATVTVPAGRELYGIYQAGSSAVTPLTDATYRGMLTLVTGGASLSTAIARAVQTSSTAFGFNFTTTTPDALGTGIGQKEYAALLGGISRLLNANPALSAFTSTPPFDLVLALVADLADGKLNGLTGAGSSIMVPTDPSGTTTLPWPALSATDLSAWLTEVNAYAASVPALNGIAFPTNTSWNPAASGGGGGGSGGTITFGGTGVAYLPANTCTPDSNYVYAGTQLVWYDRAKHVEITAIPGSVSGTIETLYVVYSPYVWTVHNSGGIPNIIVSGGKTIFTNAVVYQFSPTGTADLTLSGTLTNPIWYGSIDYTGALPAGTATPDSVATPGGGTYQWFDRANKIEIRTVLADQGTYLGEVQTVLFIRNASAVWSAHGASGLVGVGVAGNALTFNNMQVFDINNLSSYIQMTGTLYIPASP